MLCCKTVSTLSWQSCGLVVIDCRLYGFSTFLMYSNGTPEPANKKCEAKSLLLSIYMHLSEMMIETVFHLTIQTFICTVSFNVLLSNIYFPIYIFAICFIYSKVIWMINCSSRKNISVFQFDHYTNEIWL